MYIFSADHLVLHKQLVCYSLGKLHVTDGDHYPKPQLFKIQSCGALKQWIHLQNTPMPKAQGTF